MKQELGFQSTFETIEVIEVSLKAEHKQFPSVWLSHVSLTLWWKKK